VVGSYLIAFLAALAFRLAIVRLPRTLRAFLDPGPWGDALAYFLQIQHYRNRCGSEPDPRCLFRGRILHTPSYYHRFVCGLFPDRVIWSRPWLPNLLLYAVATAGFFTLAAMSLRVAGAAVVGLATLLLVAQADSSQLDNQSVHYLTIQPRLLGAMTLSLHALLFIVMPSVPITVALGSLLIFVALNTSVFSRQVAYFVLPLSALLAWNTVPLIDLIAGTLLSLLFNREEFAESFLAHLRYATWYFRNFYETRPGSGIEYWVRRSFAPAIRYLPRYADSLIALALLLTLLARGEDDFARRAAAVIGGALIVCGVTALRRFASLGECWRYLSFSLYFAVPLAIVHAVLRLGVPLGLVFALAAMELLWNLAMTLRGDGKLTNPIAEITALLSSMAETQSRTSVWWSAHFRYGSIPVALGWGGSTFEIQGTDMSEEVMAQLFVRYPYLQYDEDFLEAHRVTHLLISKAEWPRNLYGSMEVFVGAHRVLAESDNYVILARNSI